MGEKPCCVCLGRDYIEMLVVDVPFKILLSLAGRVPVLANANVGL